MLCCRGAKVEHLVQMASSAIYTKDSNYVEKEVSKKKMVEKGLALLATAVTLALSVGRRDQVLT